MHECNGQEHCSHGCEHEKDSDGNCQRRVIVAFGCGAYGPAHATELRSCHADGVCHCADSAYCEAQALEEERANGKA